VPHAPLLALAAFEFSIYLWGMPETNDRDALARVLAESGFTVVDARADELDRLAELGLEAMVHDPTPALVRAARPHRGLWGYHVVDEPYPEDSFAPIAERIRELREIDPDHPFFVNMLSTTGEFLRTYMKVVEPDILSFDYYQWWWGGDRYFEKLEQFREQAVRAGVPLGSCVEVTANPGIERGDRAYLPDNRAKLRQSVHTNLAYGVKMIEWFSGRILFEPGGLELSPWGRDVASLNHEVRHLGRELAKLDSVDVFHTAPLPRGTREAPKEHWVQLIGEEDRAGLVLGMFEDAEGTDYAFVVNRDYRESQSVTVRLQSKWLGIAPWHTPKKYSYAIEKLDKTTGAWETISSTSFVGFTFVLDAAGGELFRIRTRIEPLP